MADAAGMMYCHMLVPSLPEFCARPTYQSALIVQLPAAAARRFFRLARYAPTSVPTRLNSAMIISDDICLVLPYVISSLTVMMLSPLISAQFKRK